LAKDVKIISTFEKKDIKGWGCGSVVKHCLACGRPWVDSQNSKKKKDIKMVIKLMKR
jgi:hypothetical protein